MSRITKKDRRTRRLQPLERLAVVMALLPALVHAQEPPEGQCENNQPPVAACHTWVEVPLDEQCEWTVNAAAVDNGSTDPDGHSFECSLTRYEGIGFTVRPTITQCQDVCGASNRNFCETLIVPRDNIAPTMEIGEPVATFELVRGWVYNWTHVDDACGISFADNCTSERRIMKGIVGIEAEDPNETVEGQPGFFYSDGILADWFGFMLDLDATSAGPRAYWITYAVMDLSENLLVMEQACRIEVVRGLDETCDGFDDNGDGQIDEDYVPRSIECGVGSCARNGQVVCVDGQLVEECTPGAPGEELCEGADNDCDGATDCDDEDCHGVLAACTDSVLHTSPVNGAMDVSRFPVLSIAFDGPIPEDEAELSEAIRLFDRIGQPVALRVRRSEHQDSVAIAVPASAADRLEPVAHYFLQVALPNGSPEQVYRSHFRTGGLKSSFCNQRAADGIGWESTCNESYWRDDPVFEGTVNSGVCNEPSETCTCTLLEETVVGGRKGVCVCSEEEAFLGQDLTDSAVVMQVDPPAGANRDVDAAALITITLDRDLGDSASRYGVTIEDVTDGGSPPTTVTVGAVAHSDRSISVEAPELEANRRYKVTLSLEDGAPPEAGAPWVAGPEPHRVSWTFNTLESTAGRLTKVIPTPRTDGVDFATHLPTRPHLRFLFDEPVPVADSDGPFFEVRLHEQLEPEVVGGVASWYNLDMNRMHLMVYEDLQEGQRYEVFCTPEFAEAIGQAECATEPVARFLTQVTPPEAIIEDMRAGSRTELQPADEIWLAVRPTVLNYPHGIKERYAVDEHGPSSFLGHVMVVPPAPDVARTIRVDPAEGCVALETPPLDWCGGPPFVAASTACDPNDEDACIAHGKTYQCARVTVSGVEGIPYNRYRCQWNPSRYQSGLTEYCRQIVAGQPACSLRDAARCVGGGAMGCGRGSSNRMNAATEEECPEGYHLITEEGREQNCVPTGRTAIELAAGEHEWLRWFEVWWSGWPGSSGVYWDAVSESIIERPPPVVIQPASLEEAVVVKATTPLPADGLPIPSETCHSNATPGDPYWCPYSNGICDTSGDTPTFRCIPAEQGQTTECGWSSPNPGIACSADGDCSEGFRCHEDLRMCIADGNSEAFTCTGGNDDHSEIGGTCTSEWVQVDATANIWRIWWPSRALSCGARRFLFSARIATREGSFQGLSLLDHTLPDYDACDEHADPEACVIGLCNQWNDLDYKEQVAYQVARLRDDAIPAPYGLWVVGYDIELSLGAEETCDLGSVGGITARTLAGMDGAQGLFVKLPEGTSPDNYRIEGGVEENSLGNLSGLHDWIIRGLSFVGYPVGMMIGGGADVTVRGNQFWGNGTQNGRPDLHGLFTTSVKGVTFSDNYMHLASLVQHYGDSIQYRTTNNVVWKGTGKVHHGSYSGDFKATPVLCDGDESVCVRPLCQHDPDCRIPFFNADGTATADPEVAGVFPTCDDIDPATGIGTCSHGLYACEGEHCFGQGLFMDNVILDTGGLSGSKWFLIRMQRNHFENVLPQELVDASGAAFMSVLDNAIFNATSNVAMIFMQPAAMEDGTYYARSIAMENNLISKNAPQRKAQLPRAGKLHPDYGSAWPLGFGWCGLDESGRCGGGLTPDVAGLRIVGNTFLSRPGAEEWGDAGSIGIHDTQSILVENNTLLAETRHGLILSDRIREAPPSTGRVVGNLILPTSRETVTDNLCINWSVQDVSLSVTSDVSLCNNVSMSPPDVLPQEGCGEATGYVYLEPSDRRHMFNEPLFDAPVIDMETYQRHIVRNSVAEWDAYRAWPVYEPALLDDVFEVRPAHRACAYGSTDTCEAP